MRKLFLALVTALLVVCFCQSRPVIQAEPHGLPLSDYDPALEDMFRGFAVYSAFLGECRSDGIYQIPLNGSNKARALNYLSQSFEPYLAAAIVEECTRWDDSVQSLVIIPTDGIPVLTRDDSDKIRTLGQDSATSVFEREYTDCYEPGDRYLFRVTMKKSGDNWKIGALEFLQQNNERMQRSETI